MQLDTMLTVDEYARLPQASHRLELSRGLLVRQPHPSPLHASVSARIYDVLRTYAAGVGARAVVNTGFVLQEEPPTVRGPDVALLDAADADSVHNGLIRGAPRLAVEVAPPSVDGARADLVEKVFEYFDAGAAAVWLVDSLHQSVIAFEAGAKPTTYRRGERIIGHGALQGLDLPVAALFS